MVILSRIALVVIILATILLLFSGCGDRDWTKNWDGYATMPQRGGYYSSVRRACVYDDCRHEDPAGQYVPARRTTGYGQVDDRNTVYHTERYRRHLRSRY